MGAEKLKLIAISILVLLGTLILSTALSINTNMSVWGCPRRCEGVFAVLCYYFTFYMVFYYFTPKDFSTFSFTLISIAFLTGIYALYQEFGADPYSWLGNYGGNTRPFSTLSHPAFYSTFLIMTIPFIYHEILKGKNYLLPVLCFILYILIVAKSRACLIGLGVSTIYYFYMSPSFTWKKYWKYICVGILFIILLNVFVVESPIKRMIYDIKNPSTRIHRSTVHSRIDMWGVGLHIISKAPIYGYGPETLSELYRYAYMGKRGHWPHRDQNRLHNEFLDILYAKGILGLLAWVFFLFAYFRYVWMHRSNPLVILCSSSAIAYLIQNQFSFGVIPITLLFWYIIGLTLVVNKNVE